MSVRTLFSIVNSSYLASLKKKTIAGTQLIFCSKEIEKSTKIWAIIKLYARFQDNTTVIGYIRS